VIATKKSKVLPFISLDATGGKELFKANLESILRVGSNHT